MYHVFQNELMTQNGYNLLSHIKHKDICASYFIKCVNTVFSLIVS